MQRCVTVYLGRQARQWALPDDTDALAHGVSTARAARCGILIYPRNNSDSVVVTNPRLPLARLGGYWGSGIFFVVLL